MPSRSRYRDTFCVGKLRKNTGWWFGTLLGMSSSQLTFTPSFFRGVGQPPSRIKTPRINDPLEDVLEISLAEEKDSSSQVRKAKLVVLAAIVFSSSSACAALEKSSSFWKSGSNGR